MKFKCECTILQKAINVVQRAAAVKTTLAILECMKIEVKDKVILKSNNLDIAIEYKLDADIEESGEILVNVKIFGEIIRKLQTGEVTVTCKGNLIGIFCNNSVFNIKGMDSDSFPEIPQINEGECVQISPEKLNSLIKDTVFSISSESSKPILTGLLLDIWEDHITTVGIDSYRMAVKKEKVENISKKISAVVPGKTMSELSRVLDGEDDNINIYIAKKQIQFVFSKFKLVSRLLEGEFLDYRGIVPRELGTMFKINKVLFENAIERTMIVIPTEEKKYPVDVSTKNNILNISISTHIGEVLEKIEIEVIGEDIDVSFNPKFFADCLKVIKDDEILIKCNTEVGPCIISPVEGDDYLYLIGAVRR